MKMYIVHTFCNLLLTKYWKFQYDFIILKYYLRADNYATGYSVQQMLRH